MVVFGFFLMSEQINILIVENEVLIAHMAESMLIELGYIVVGKARNVAEALNIIANNKVDIALLDINLYNGTEGIDLGQQLKDHFQIPFIYLTSYTNKGVIKKATLTNPGGYVIKPFNKTDLFSSIEICLANVKQFSKETSTEVKKEGETFIQIRINKRFIKISSKDILYIKADNVYIEIYTKDAKHTERMSLKQIIKILPQNNFIKVHRSYIINKEQITSWNSKLIYITNIPVPLSKSYQKAFFELIR